MSMVTVNIKNSGKTYPVEVDLTEPGLTFKLQIFSLTNIPPERQKVLLKGGQLKDDSDLNKFNLKSNQTIMVLGTPDNTILNDKPKEAIKFLEDNAKNGGDISKLDNNPLGLVNLGNTCYLNSSLQTLNKIEELKEDLIKYERPASPSLEDKLVFNLKELFNRLNNNPLSENSITPLNFLSNLRLNLPQFNERSNEGFFKQQDAEEAYSQILTILLKKFPKLTKFFTIEFKKYTKCIELPESEVEVGYDEALKLNCHITIQTNFLKDGLINDLKEVLEKNNEVLGRDAKYEIERKITKLPKYLTVHFVRFFWKRETNKKSKILRKVQFPFELDLVDLVDDSVKDDIVKVRDDIYKIEKQNEEEVRTFKKTKLGVSNTNETLNIKDQLVRQKDEFKKLNSQWKQNYIDILPKDFDLNSGENPSSLYELTSIIAHQGSNADSGHYQAFIKDDNDLTGENWWRFNDDKVSVVKRDKIESLAGGSEGDSALILLYKGVGLP